MGLAIRKHTCLAVSVNNSSGSNNDQSFESYLKSQNKRNIRQIVSYAQRYHSILETGDVSPLINLQSNAMRRHAMESLTSLSKYFGCYDDGRKYVNATNFAGHQEMNPLRVWNDSSILTSHSITSMTEFGK